jgi:hypothetical protein
MVTRLGMVLGGWKVTPLEKKCCWCDRKAEHSLKLWFGLSSRTICAFHRTDIIKFFDGVKQKKGNGKK